MTREEFLQDRARERDSDLRALMATAAGRRLAWRIINEWGALQDPSFDPAGDRGTNLHEGRRAVGLSLYRETQRVCPDLHLAMVGEALQREQQDRLYLASLEDT